MIFLFLLSLSFIANADNGSCPSCAPGDAPSLKGTGPEDLNAEGGMEYPLMRLPLDMLLKEQEASKKLSRVKITDGLMAVPPGSYSLLDRLDYVPEERDQGRCGSCWVWSSTVVTELDLAYRKGIKDRLSIQYFLSNFPRFREGQSACCGDFETWFADFYTSEGRLIPWSSQNAGWGGKYSDYNGLFYPPYTRWDCCNSSNYSRCSNNYPPKMPANCIATAPSYSISYITPLIIPTHDDEYDGNVGKEEAIANIKKVLRSNKGVSFGYYLDDFGPFFEFWDTEHEDAVWTPSPGPSYLTGAYPGGHGVLCVGYNDTDPDNRYWIMLNSWGAPSNRLHGLFRVNMDMDYSYVYEEGLKAFVWLTFDVVYPEGSNPETPDSPAGPEAGVLGVQYSYAASAIDPDGDQIKYTFDWGDKTTSETGFVDSGSEAETSHAWVGIGTYQIKAMATDSQGISSGWSPSRDVTISDNRPPYSPTRLYGPKRGLRERSYSYSTSAADPDGDLLRCTFDWGDGTTTTTSLMPSGTRASASHAWADKGTYQIRVKAVDSRCVSSGWTATSIGIV